MSKQIKSQLGDHGSKPHDPWTFWIKIKNFDPVFDPGSKKNFRFYDPDQKK